MGKLFIKKALQETLFSLAAFSVFLNLWASEPTSPLYPIPSEADTLFCFGTPSSKRALPHRIKFVVWNLHKGEDAPFPLEYARFVRGADVVLSQEIFLDEAMMDLFYNIPHFEYVTATSFLTGKNLEVRTGVANASSVQRVASSFLRTIQLEPIARTPKISLITKYALEHSASLLTVVNVHAINFVSTKKFNREMARLFSRLKELPFPLVLAGDFNTWNAGRMSSLLAHAKKLGLFEALFTPDYRMTFNGYPLDHFFYSPDLKLISSSVQSETKGSDHRPLFVELEYSPRKNSSQISPD